MVASVSAGAGTGELVVGTMDDLLGESTGRCDCSAEGDENWETRGAFWAVSSRGVCDCAGAGELFAAAAGVTAQAQHLTSERKLAGRGRVWYTGGVSGCRITAIMYPSQG